MALNNSALKVNIEPHTGGVDALHLSVTYGDRSAEATIPLKLKATQVRDDHFIRGEISRLGEALQALAKSHGA